MNPLTAIKAVGTGVKMLFSGSTENPANKVLDGLISGLDNRKLTSEEAVQYRSKLFDKQIDYMDKQRDENSVRSVARREIAKDIVKVELSLLLMAVAVYPFDKLYAEFVLSVAMFLGTAFISVIVFYFGYYGWEKITGKDKNK